MDTEDGGVVDSSSTKFHFEFLLAVVVIPLLIAAALAYQLDAVREIVIAPLRVFWLFAVDTMQNLNSFLGSSLSVLGYGALSTERSIVGVTIGLMLAASVVTYVQYDARLRLRGLPYHAQTTMKVLMPIRYRVVILSVILIALGDVFVLYSLWIFVGSAATPLMLIVPLAVFYSVIIFAGVVCQGGPLVSNANVCKSDERMYPLCNSSQKPRPTSPENDL